MARDQNFQPIFQPASPRNSLTYTLQSFSQLWRWILLAIILLCYLAISGCVQYDVGVNFAGPHQGVLVQHIRLEEELSGLGGKQAHQWLKSVEARVASLSGQIKRSSPQEITVQIPFNSGQELVEKFNAFFQSSQVSSSKQKNQETLPDLDLRFDLQQSNFLLLQRNHLQLDLDLRSLGLVSPEGEVIINPGSLFELEFSLESPWGARNITKVAKTDKAIAPIVSSIVSSIVSPIVSQNGHKLTWQLLPAQLNHLEAVFWLPSPIGLGAVVIMLLTLAGFYGKYRQLPWDQAGK